MLEIFNNIGLRREGMFRMTLDQLGIEESGVIKTVGGSGPLRCRFLDMGLIPRTKVKMIKMAPLGDPIQIYIRGYELTIRKEDAEKIELEAVE